MKTKPLYLASILFVFLLGCTSAEDLVGPAPSPAASVVEGGGGENLSPACPGGCAAGEWCDASDPGDGVGTCKPLNPGGPGAGYDRREREFKPLTFKEALAFIATPEYQRGEPAPTGYLSE